MIHIQKGAPPLELIQAKRAGLTRYDDMDTPTKDAIREQLYVEQFHLCAYCMRRLDIKTMQIEHYIAQNPEDGNYNPSLTIDYQNMLGVCPGGKGQVHIIKQMTCDQHRKNIPLTVDPLDTTSIAKICYTSDGGIDSEDYAIRKDVQETLNLNCPEALLKENRKAALDALKNWVYARYKGKSVSKTEWQRIHSKYCSAQNGQKREYVGIIEWYLKKKI